MTLREATEYLLNRLDSRSAASPRAGAEAHAAVLDLVESADLQMLGGYHEARQHVLDMAGVPGR